MRWTWQIAMTSAGEAALLALLEFRASSAGSSYLFVGMKLIPYVGSIFMPIGECYYVAVAHHTRSNFNLQGVDALYKHVRSTNTKKIYCALLLSVGFQLNCQDCEIRGNILHRKRLNHSPCIEYVHRGI